MPKSIQQNSNETLTLSIKIIGCVDIILLCVYLTVCIYDRTGQEKTTDIATVRSHFREPSATYENIEVASFSV